MTDFLIADPPSDGISSVKYSPTDPNALLVASWDKTVRLYDTNSNNCLFSYKHHAPVLDCVLTADSRCFSCGIDKRVLLFDAVNQTESELTKHDEPVKSLAFDESKNLLFSGGWDKTLKAIDVNSKTTTQKYQLPGKVYSMSLANDMLVVAMSDRHVYIFDTRNMKEPYQKRESSMKFQTRCVQMFPSADAYVLSSIEGRYGTFASGGGDGVINIWDGLNRKRIRQYPKYPTSISGMAFNCDGTQLAIASSYSFEEGVKDHPEDNIYIKQVADSEVRPKNRSAA